MHAIVQVPRAVSRSDPSAARRQGRRQLELHLPRFLIKQHVADLFPGLLLDGVHAFRVTRNSDLYVDEEEADNLLRSIEQELRRSSQGNAVRLEVEADCPDDFSNLLLEFFQLTEADLLQTRWTAFDDASRAPGRERRFRQVEGPCLSADPRSGAAAARADIFEAMRKQDILLHHPYESLRSGGRTGGKRGDRSARPGDQDHALPDER